MIKKLLIFLIFMSGCQNVPFLLLQKQPSIHDIAMDDCRQFGYIDGTEEFRQCVERTYNSERQRRSAMGAAMLQGGALNTPEAPKGTYRPIETNTSVITNCMPNGAGGLSCVSK